MTPIQWRSVAAAQLTQNPSLQAAWDHLNAQRLDLAFLSSDTVCAAIEVFGSADEQLVIGESADRIVALFVMAPEGRLKWHTFQPSQVPLGCWVAEAGLGLPELCAGLLRAMPLPCLAVGITQVDPLAEPRPGPDAREEAVDYIPTAWLEVQGNFEGYWAARGKNLRQNMRKQRNKLAADGTTAHMRMLTEPADMAGAIARYGQLESQGWKAAAGTAVHPDNDQGRFYRRLLEQAARRGEALVYEYLFGERTVAMDLGVQRGGVLVVLKTTYDETIPKALSPAALLREEELQHAFDAASGISRIEYYGRVMEWHTKLTDNSRTLYHLTHYRWSWLKTLAQRRRAAPEPAAQHPVATEE